MSVNEIFSGTQNIRTLESNSYRGNQAINIEDRRKTLHTSDLITNQDIIKVVCFFSSIPNSNLQNKDQYDNQNKQF
jgi:hypothetical protein